MGTVCSKNYKRKLSSAKPKCLHPTFDFEMKNQYNLVYRVGCDELGPLDLVVSKQNNQKYIMRTVHKQQSKNNTDFKIDFYKAKTLRHKNIARCYFFQEDPYNFYSVTEYCSGASIQSKLLAKGRFTEKEASQILSQILETVKYLNTKGFYNCGLELKSFVFKNSKINSQLKLVDLFLQKSAKESDTQTCGDMLFTMLTGKFLDRVKKPFQLLNHYGVSSSGINLLQQLLNPNTCPQKALNHPWLTRDTISNPTVQLLTHLSEVLQRSLDSAELELLESIVLLFRDKNSTVSPIQKALLFMQKPIAFQGVYRTLKAHKVKLTATLDYNQLFHKLFSVKKANNLYIC